MNPNVPPVADELHGVAMTEAEFALLRDVIHQRSGILLRDGKASLLVARLARRLRALGLRSFMEYYQRVMEGDDPEELDRMLDLVCTNKTRFFREPAQFQFLEEVICPRWKHDRARGLRSAHVRCWSAACSTGEEAYSAAMTLLAHLPPEDGWSGEILGTDLSHAALETARAGVWPSDQARHIPPAYLRRFMRRGTRTMEGSMTATAELRRSILFGRMNLTDAAYPVEGEFDLILCRNVLIYFDESTREAVLERLVGRLAPGGYLLLGHAEGSAEALRSLERAGTMIFRRSPDEVRPRRPESTPPSFGTRRAS